MPENDNEDESDESDDETEVAFEGTSSTVKLKPWSQRKYAGLEPTEQPTLFKGTDTITNPLIDRVHRLMHLWRAGDVVKVNAYMDRYALGYNTLFGQLLQALIELAPAGSEERAILESISNHVTDRSGTQTNRLTWVEM